MTYEEALEIIHGTERFGIKPGLARIERLLERLGSPHRQLKFIHIAGTNGKGSVTATIAGVLREAGYRTGMYISPFIEEFRERISINGEMIPEQDLADLFERVHLEDQAMKREDGMECSEFELVTAVAMLYYLREHCDIVVLETGLGGRFDATNVIDTPLCSVIMSISLDHTEYLGDTIDKIACEKAGIIKEGGHTVLYPIQLADTYRVVQDRAAEMHNTLVVPDTTKINITKDSLDGVEFDYTGLHVTLGMLGEHQIYNTVTALEALRIVKEKGFPVSKEQLLEGIRKVRFMGRFEICAREPLIVLDGGHNVSGIKTLTKSIKNYIRPSIKGRLYVIMGILRDKEYKKCISSVAKLCDSFVAVAPDSARMLDPKIGAKIAGVYCDDVRSCKYAPQALDSVLKKATADDAIVVCGSLYLLGGVRRHIRELSGVKKLI
ncbi:bifunctional folylpolyglutamate synthase/dihydrofolate synthase [Feifania hominis]|uniref:tetrahydrofolate synthase n=1 Tax=Feifania hominis TaxID=2763660 RepID=A0A926DBF6_9FIRM|nr:folylpolyglutamate synthase/dihydrofolate synthase family protein [Feifania hominis]MBC8535448.1 bifunctional folylpolyglutamate synthase/dihydrofolate synthase [Feifania hominis]